MSVNNKNNAQSVYVASAEEAEAMASVLFKTIDKAQQYPYTHKQLKIKLQEDGYVDINSNKLNKLIKEHKIKNNDAYAYRVPMYKQIHYKYSEACLDFLKQKLST